MSRPFHILIAEDDPDDRLILDEAIRQFTKIPVLLNFVKSGDELLQTIRRYEQDQMPVDLIILDINMPLMSGLEALQKMREENIGTGVPVRVLSTLRTPERESTSKALGALEYHVKPNNYNDYETIIEQMVIL